MIFSKLKKFVSLLKATALAWWARDPLRDSATISYYTIFSLPGLLIVIINSVGYFMGEKSTREELIRTVENIIGNDASSMVETIVSNTSAGDSLTISSIVGGISLLFGATAAFIQLQKSLNNIWDVEPAPQQMIFKFLKDRAFSFGVVLMMGFLMLVSLILSATISLLSNWLAKHFSIVFHTFANIMDFVLSITVITVLFAAIFKILPDAHVKWKDVWSGALLTAILFVIGKFILATYLSHSDPASAYGAAGSIVIIMLWVSFASALILFGAEFTKAFAASKGIVCAPTELAVVLDATKTPSKSN